MELSEIREIIIEALKKEEDFQKMSVAEINGFHFSAADIAVPDGKGGRELYRIAVIKQNAYRKCGHGP